MNKAKRMKMKRKSISIKGKNVKEEEKEEKQNKILLIVLDGLGDMPITKKQGLTGKARTPLELARKPNIDRLAREGITGISIPIENGIIPGSDTGHLALLGYDPYRFYVGRGILEALGAGIDIKPGELAFRANFCTVEKIGGRDSDNWKVIDRRAGRISDREVKQLADAIARVEIKIKDEFERERSFETLFYHTTSHRGVLVIRSKGDKYEKIELCPLISDIDTHKTGKYQWSKELDSSENARITAQVLNEAMKKINQILEQHYINQDRKKKGLPVANAIITRGASMIKSTVREGTVKEGAEYNGLYGWAVQIKPFYERYNMSGACIAGGSLYKGVSKYVGMDVIDVPGATANYDTDLDAKVRTAIHALQNYDFVFLHIKATDVAGHDGDWKMKMRFIEKIDKALKPILDLKNTIVVLTADHSTPCILKAHSADPVPILIWGPEEMIRTDNVTRFDERSVTNGGLGHIRHLDLMPILLGILEKGIMYGT